METQHNLPPGDDKPLERAWTRSELDRERTSFGPASSLTLLFFVALITVIDYTRVDAIAWIAGATGLISALQYVFSTPPDKPVPSDALREASLIVGILSMGLCVFVATVTPAPIIAIGGFVIILVGGAAVQAVVAHRMDKRHEVKE